LGCCGHLHKDTSLESIIYPHCCLRETSLMLSGLWTPLKSKLTFLNLLIYVKWFEISDERIILVIIYRTFQYYASDSNSNMSFWGSSNNLNAIAQWWFSSTFLSLYLRAFVCFIAIKKELFTPLNSKMLLILYLRMCHIATQTSQKSCHYIKIWKMLH